ncbi:MAG: hypothetical protein K5873_08095 [Treponema sp.]|nr:hypothetical protein [Treponema sp.]
MKKYRFFKALMMLMLFAANFLSCSMGEDGKDGKDGKDAESITKPTYDVIIEELTKKDTSVRGIRDGQVVDAGNFPLFFRDGMEDIPYIIIDDNILNFFYGEVYSISDVNADTKEVTIKNTKTNTKSIIDLAKHEFYFENYEAFFQTSDVYLDIVDCNELGDYIKMIDSSNIAGQSFYLDWRKHDIGLVICKFAEDDYCLAMPLQTFSDIYGRGYVYNGKNLYKRTLLADNSAIAADYYGTEEASGVRSEKLAEFCYNELCMNLDLNYGLKGIHGISNFPDFDSYFRINGISDALKSTDALTFANALKDVCGFYFGDGHSVYDWNSYYLGKNASPVGSHTPSMEKNYIANMKKYAIARNNKIGAGSADKKDPVPCYTLSDDGKTAIVRFDNFTLKAYKKEKIIELSSEFDDEKMNSYAGNLEKTYDTILLIHVINKKIQENSNIENIVLDMSYNGGGACHSAAFVLSWLLGECTFDLSNPITGAKWSATYVADVNLDGVYDEQDTVKSKNIFCLTSPISFSCGNMVPSVLKFSDRATILGARSGGGTSVVYATFAADGTGFSVSSKNVMSVAKNGSTYDIDTGIEPHYYINKPENFYDTGKISALVNAINEAKLAN